MEQGEELAVGGRKEADAEVEALELEPRSWEAEARRTLDELLLRLIRGCPKSFGVLRVLLAGLSWKKPTGRARDKLEAKASLQLRRGFLLDSHMLRRLLPPKE